MDTRKEMIVIQGVIKTCKVALCEYNREIAKFILYLIICTSNIQKQESYI